MLRNILKLIRIAYTIEINDVSKQLLSRRIKRVENGTTKMSLNTLSIFSEYYEIPISYILVLNDLQEHSKATDEEILKYITDYYNIQKQNEKNKQKVL